MWMLVLAIVILVCNVIVGIQGLLAAHRLWGPDGVWVLIAIYIVCSGGSSKNGA